MKEIFLSVAIHKYGDRQVDEEQLKKFLKIDDSEIERCSHCMDKMYRGRYVGYPFTDKVFCSVACYEAHCRKMNVKGLTR